MNDLDEKIDELLLDISIDITHLKSLEDLIYDKEFFNKLGYIEQRSYRERRDITLSNIRDKYKDIAPLLKQYEKEKGHIVNMNYIRLLKTLRQHRLL